MSPDEKLQVIQGLITKQRYEEARRMLVTVEHPRTEHWLAILDAQQHAAHRREDAVLAARIDTLAAELYRLRLENQMMRHMLHETRRRQYTLLWQRTPNRAAHNPAQFWFGLVTLIALMLVIALDMAILWLISRGGL